MSIDWAPSYFGETFVMRSPDGVETSLVRATAAFEVIDRLESERDAMRPVVQVVRDWLRIYEAGNTASLTLEHGLRRIAAAMRRYEENEECGDE